MDMNRLQAYELVTQEKIDDIRSMGYLLRHKKSGARVMVLENEDENKVFNITFRTTPSNSTGVAHILEHSVLCGSRKFPSKDPFVELVKGSMNTFLNAMTFPDKTMYPIASCNDTDFKNLMHVYMDAVFYPNIYQKEEIFRQEGWHYQIEKPEDDLVVNGVVYNEMKGAFSSPDDVLEREILNSLFPDNTYHYESGGAPECIPSLRYEDFLEFHKKYYHPSNSYIYLYGDMDVEERLEWMDREYLRHFDYYPVDSVIELQRPFEKPVKVYKKYPIGQGDTEENHTYLSYNVVVGTSLDTRLATAFAVLEYALLEAPGAPLKEALLDAGIGEDIMSSYSSEEYQPVFSIIAKNANRCDEGAFAEIIRSTLNDLCEQGIDRRALKAAVNLMEFKFREADYGRYPKGLMYGIDIFDSWLYDDTKPFDYLKQLADFEFLKQQMGSGYFEELIRKWVLDNTHAALVVVEPEKGLTAKEEQALKERLEQIKAGMSADEIQGLIEKYKKLRVFQETPSTKEELEMIPMLSRKDMKKEADPILNHTCSWNGIRVLHQPYETNGIAYLTLLFDASVLKTEDIPYLGILKNVLGMVDTEHYSYKELYNEINMNTGGITPGISIFPDGEHADLLKAAMGIQVRTLYDQIEYAFRMIEEILFTSDLGQEKRLLEILRKQKSRLQAQLTSSGSATAAVRALSHISPMYLFNDQISGIGYYRVIEELEKTFEETKEALKDRLQSVLSEILRTDGMVVSFTGDEEGLKRIRAGVEHLQERIRQSEKEKTEHKELSELCYLTGLEPVKNNEGFQTPGQVQYVAQAGNFKHSGFAYTGALKVLKVIMSYEYLWTHIRVMGGAYGCSGSFSSSGETYFVSYRDPHLKNTLEIYRGIPEYLEQFTVDERDMTKYVIGTISDMDTPLTPAGKGRRSMNAVMNNISWERLQKSRDEVLSVSQEDIRALAPMMKAVLEQEHICALGNEEKLAEHADIFDELCELK